MKYENMRIKSDDGFSITIELKRKDLKAWAKILMMPRYAVTELMFPKKKKRGTMRRRRRTSNYGNKN